MRIRSFLSALILMLLISTEVRAASNPIPGVGIVVKRNPGTSSALVLPAGFFGPGSQPFEGRVGLQGRCSHDCGGCDNDCAGSESNPDGRIDYAYDVLTGPFDVIMQSTTLYSDAPIEVMIDGAPSFFDVFVTISGQFPPADDPVIGALHLASGSLDIGVTATVRDANGNFHCHITFADHTTGMIAGSSVEMDLHMEMQDSSVAITRLADGTPSGVMVLGRGVSSTDPITFASAGGELELKILSLYTPASVPVQSTTWENMKLLYHEATR
jgi:hypothetical protein